MFKDTPDGQTHSFNDGCGEPAHNDAAPKDIVEGMIGKHIGPVIKACFYNDGTKKSITDVIDIEIPALIRDIKQTLHATEARVRAEILTKDIEEMERTKKEDAHDYCVDSQDGCEMCANGIYNQALTDLITKKKEAFQALTKEQQSTTNPTI